jgi:hypothetical protein
VTRLLRLGPLARRIFSLNGVRYAGLLTFVALSARCASQMAQIAAGAGVRFR